MKDYTGGTWITLEAISEKGNPPMFIGYKYNKKKVLTLVMSKGAGKSTDGEPYKAPYLINMVMYACGWYENLKLL